MITTTAARRVGAALAALFAGLLAMSALAPAAHAAAPDTNTIVSEWQKNGRFYYDPAAKVPDDSVARMRDAVAQAGTVYLAVLPAGSVTQSEAKGFLSALSDKVGGDNTVGVMVGTGLAAHTSISDVNVIRLISKAQRSSDNATDRVVNFVGFAEAAGTGKAVTTGSNAPQSGGGSGLGALVALGVLALAGGGGYFLYSRSKNKKQAAIEAEQLSSVKKTVEEDVTKFGEEITELDVEVRLLGAGAEHQADWQHALDSYEKAKSELTAVKHPQEIRNVTTALEDGRYALACVKARVEKRPLPERRAPCFFNPQHGPSSRDVRWAPPGGTLRDVPACSADAEAIEQGFDPQMRTVMVNGQRRPYWEAGPAYQPYASGYYGGFGDVMSMMLVGTMLGSMMGGWGYGGYGAGYDAGYEQGLDAGVGDLGSGGSDFGGSDMGGWGDFGGGDFGGF
ncbi:LPXTG cell wall anchor domain-containing protein [Sinosporangium siamense]|uniref:Uncharacterized protein n=1 Tax=Sinosporangium siamense TaxID=1367973 RepID=A0A919REH4_9ACTN|nr:LPXTG cell wall anchor domain-containing protein [Sinosporangium siamense]GII90929.1 hypothetical protein Ssi02_11600 [Sinosporangium siamense]